MDLNNSKVTFKESNCGDFIKIEAATNQANSGHLIDLKKCNTMYTAKTTDPQTLKVLDAHVDLKCTPTV